ncbi:MAG: hypothetical protein KDK37_19080, partial [Leptospiraceae bacterium]|nr:hypothetical protein [Leptospiraceae bacterium]
EVTFGGHVVIDGDRYGFMAPGGGKFVQDHYDQDKLGSFRDTSTHPLLGIKINGPESLALAGKAICESEKEPDSTYLIMTDSVGRVSLGISVSGDLIPEGEEAESPDTARFRGWARNLSRASGSKMRFLVVPKKLYDEKKHQLGALIRSGLFTDILVKETSTSVMNALMIQPGMTKDPVLRIRRQATKVNESMETTKSRIIQIVKSALADKSHLVRKVITNKLGRKQTVLVRADEIPGATESMPDAKVEGFRNADYGNGRNIEIEDLKGISKTLDWLIDKAQKHVLSTDSETNGTRSRTEVFRVRLSIRQKKFFHAMDSTIKKLQKIFGSNHFTNKDGSREFLVSIEKEPVSGASYANFKFLQTVPLEPSDGGSIDYFAANEFIRSLPTTEEKDF